MSLFAAVFGASENVSGIWVSFAVAMIVLAALMLRRASRPDIGANEIDPTTYDRALDIVERCGERLTLLAGDDFTVMPFTNIARALTTRSTVAANQAAR